MGAAAFMAVAARFIRCWLSSASDEERKAFSAALGAKIAKVDINQAKREDILRVFGPPTGYTWGGKTFSQDELPAVYAMQYPSGFSAVLVEGSVW